jgi:tetratricopeptide (TPR) repeat protein
MIVEAGVRHVVAIRCDTPVLDRAATTFIHQFYRNLFRGDSLQKAFGMAELLVEGDPELAKIKPQLELIAQEKGERFIPEEKKFKLLPTGEPSAHLDPLISKGIPEGVVSIEEPKRSRTNLPVRPQSFTGRSIEMHDLVNELLANRFVTMKGTGGIGKTTLAVEVARWFHSREYFPDGIFQIDLRQAGTAGGVIAMLTATLEAEAAEMKEVIDYLREYQCLLLFDNAEQALWQDEKTLHEVFDAILKFAPRVRILVTSQRHVGGNLHEPEHVYPVYPMKPYNAALLFCATTKRTMSQSEWESEAFKELLKQLGGHPLSIVLVARQLVHGTSIEDLVERIQKHKAKAITIKSITDRDPEHGESLVAALSSTYDNLSEDAKTVFGILSLLPAGAQDFTIKKIFSEEGWESVKELQDASLAEITVNRRVILLPPVRLFALNVLTDDIKEQYGPKIVALMGGYAAQFYSHFGSEDAKYYRFVFTIEEPNLRFATELPCDPPRTKKEPSALGSLAPYLLLLYNLTDRHQEGKEIGNTLLVNLEKLQDKWGEANTLKALGDLAMRTDDLKEAKDRYEKALAIQQEIDAKLGEANTLKALGDLAMRTDDLKEAKDRYEKALAIHQEIDAKLGEANTLQALGDLAMRTDDLKEAKDRYEKALAIQQEIDAKLGEANTLQRLGQWFAVTDDLTNANNNFDDAMTIYRGIKDLEGQADVCAGRALVLLKSNDGAKAKQELNQCASIRNKVLAHGGAAQWLIFYSDHLRSKGFDAGAKICLEYAKDLASKARDPRLQEQVEQRLRGFVEQS